MNVKDWCVRDSVGGYTSYFSTHEFKPYNTLILGTPRYKCACGNKINPEEYIEYSKYILARSKVLRGGRE